MASWEGKWYGYIEAISIDISQEVKAWSQMGLPNGQWPQAYFQSCGKMTYGQQSQGIGIGVAITKPWPQSYRQYLGRTEKACSQGGLQTCLIYTSSIRRNGPQFTQLIVGSLWKATQHDWTKLNHLKAMLPNTDNTALSSLSRCLLDNLFVLLLIFLN